MTLPAQPTLSVSVVPLGNTESMFWCLTALQRQETQDTVEILVPHDEGLGDITELQMSFPTVRFLSFPGRLTYAELRARGVQASSGRLVAITEDHCQPERGWCQNIIMAHKDDHPAVGGAVEKTGVDSALNWAVYFADYLRYALPFGEGPYPTLTDLNASYKRSDLDEINDLWNNEFHEPEIHGALTNGGKQLWISPNIVVGQRRTFTWKSALKERYDFGRLFGSTRVAGVNVLRRLAMAVMALFIPVILVLRVAMHIFRKRRFIDQFVFSFPALVMISLAWGWGELLGYLTGRPAKSSFTTSTSKPA